jgi:polar amino acid transport system substrate-binding protein
MDIRFTEVEKSGLAQRPRRLGWAKSCAHLKGNGQRGSVLVEYGLYLLVILIAVVGSYAYFSSNSVGEQTNLLGNDLTSLAGKVKSTYAGQYANVSNASLDTGGFFKNLVSMQDTAGKPDGVGVKMAEALAAKLNRPLQIVPMEFSGLIPALQTGNVDLVLSSMTATDERRKTIDFSDPYAFTGLAVLVRKDSDIQSIDDLKKPGRSLTAKTATTAQTWITANLPAAKLVVFEDQTACVQEVVQGRADAFIYDQLSIYQYSRQNPDTTRGLLKPFVEESWALGLAKGNDGLRQQVNDFIAAFRAEKGFEKLGVSPMPPMGLILKPQELEDVKAYLQTLK